MKLSRRNFLNLVLFSSLVPNYGRYLFAKEKNKTGKRKENEEEEEEEKKKKNKKNNI